MKVIVVNILCILFLSTGMLAQNSYEKRNEKFAVEEDASLQLNLRHTPVEIETWNRDFIEIEAVVTGEDVPETTLKTLAENWDLQVIGNSKRVEIRSAISVAPPLLGFNSAGRRGNALQNMQKLNTDFLAPMLEDLYPMLEEMPSADMPASFLNQLSVLKFDYSKFKKEGEEYLRQYEEKVEKNFGKDGLYASVNNNIPSGEKSKSREERLKEREKMLAKREAYRNKRKEALEKQMEAFSKRMEEIAKHLESSQGGNYSKTVQTSPNGGKSVKIVYSSSQKPLKKETNEANETGVSYKLKIKMPKQTKVSLEVRHGAVNLQDAVTNLKATIAYSRFEAKKLSGKETQISIAYSPVKIHDWEYGKLAVNYVKNGSIKYANSIQLNAKGSNFSIGELKETGIISGSFGSFRIEKLADSFKQLSLNLTSSDVRLQLPEIAFNFNYNGKQSKFSYPESLSATRTNNYQTNIINGFQKSRNTAKNIQVIAKYSNVNFE